METLVRKINREEPSLGVIAEASRLLQKGELVAFPTETVYGLGGNALDETAARRIYKAKGRPSDNPLIVHIAELSMLSDLADEIPDAAFCLAEAFWPGPLTIILKKRQVVPDSTTGGLNTVAVRMPADEIALLLIKESGIPIAAPSANASGRPSTTRAEHVLEDLNGRIAMILDGGAATLGLESTIIDLSGPEFLILRPGFITKEDLEPFLPGVVYDKTQITENHEISVPKAPGMKYRHYAPKAEMTIYKGETSKVAAFINAVAKEKEDLGERIGILASDETAHLYHRGLIRSLGSRNHPDQIAANLFTELRTFDGLFVTVILSESFSIEGHGQAIMNRLLKAASYRLVHVAE